MLYSAVSDVQITFWLRVNEFTSVNVARVQRHAAKMGLQNKQSRFFMLYSAVSDVQLTFLLRVNELASDNVAGIKLPQFAIPAVIIAIL